MSIRPNWQEELFNFKGIKSTFIIEGNISDVYPFYAKDENGNDKVQFYSLNEVITNIFNSEDTKDAYTFQYYDPIFGASDKGFADPAIFNKKAENLNDIVKNSENIRSSMTTRSSNDKSIVNTVNFASRFLNSPDTMQPNEVAFFMNLFYASNNALRIKSIINTLVLIVNKFNDIPAWFYINNPNVRTISIPNPDRNMRSEYIKEKYSKIFGETLTTEMQSVQNKFIDITGGMKLKELDELRRLHEKEKIPTEDIADNVTIFKYGFKDNKWLQIRDKLSGINMREKIEKRVMGQSQAIEKIVQVIERAVVGLSGLQHSSNTKPRGILFLAGPTGTGKTEIVKAVTDLLFGDEKAMIRFDMSEFSAEHADQKLFGAPPGYVGYDSGGQLTNAVKNNPFSVLLFDEIEKSHPSIMDKFLQILEDGRMTDGQGNTVYFTETLIFFTSNVGISKEIVDPHTGKVIGRENIVKPGDHYDEVKVKVEEAMRIYFKPEVINRIGDNIVVFNYIAKEASELIARKQIENINKNLLKNNKIKIEMGAEAYKVLFDLCWQPKTRDNGGRGIGNVVEEQYLNPLAGCIYNNSCKEGDTVVVKPGNKKLDFEKKA